MVVPVSVGVRTKVVDIMKGERNTLRGRFKEDEVIIIYIFYFFNSTELVKGIIDCRPRVYGPSLWCGGQGGGRGGRDDKVLLIGVCSGSMTFGR